ncbi:ABC transporter permease [Phycisphaerales bacterium AB-hyl4]|uniref:ABC transporter permease n=1 Tax=Natronomicrosphaera hydrolytica TaxID=3242702 RepID=A0ABV4UA55_9BACT
MVTYIIRRLMLMVPTLFGITLIVFLVMAMAPGGIGGIILDEQQQLDTEAGRQLREYYEQRYGLDQPLLVQYGRWLNAISPLGTMTEADADDLPRLGITWPVEVDGEDQTRYMGLKAPDLGESMQFQRPVGTMIAEALPITLLLNIITIPVIYAIGITTGIFAAKFQGKTFDIGSGFTLLALWSVPTIWAAVMLIGIFANQEILYWFPTSGLQSHGADGFLFLPTWTEAGFQRGWLLDILWHLVLPIVCLSYAGFAFLSKLTRGSLLENLRADYVRTARAKGVSERDVLFRHVFRNSLLALITVAASILPALLSGSVVIEKIFSIPGMGRLAVDAVLARDREVVLAVTLVGGLIALTAELIRDICYAIADPRVSYE